MFNFNLDTYTHTKPKPEAENKMDPDDGNSMVCNACRLPIFSTPFITTVVDPDDDQNNNPIVFHDQCANDHLPRELKDHPLHPGDDLILSHQNTNTNTNNNVIYNCSRCESICGSSFYKCRSSCDFKLDLLCALTIKILHRSHSHRLRAIRGNSLSSFFCGACGSQHQPPSAASWLTVFVCIPCGFWIHPECARLPNAIVLTNDNNKDEHDHPHPLLLSYSQINNYGCCKICSRWYDGEYENSGVYVCFHCFYCAHIKCAVYADPDHQISFKPVLIRDAQVPNLIRLPMPNEHTSVMKTILRSYVGGDHTSTSIVTDDNKSDGSKLFKNDKIHEHPLIFHPPAAAAAGVARVCNACVNLISPSDPFYSCANNNNNNELASLCCRDFFLHSCCAHLPTTLITHHWSHYRRSTHHINKDPLTLVSKVNNRLFNMFRCSGCQRQCNGFAYTCAKCYDFYLDVVCAFMHTSITYDGHANSHILHSRDPFIGSKTCICCGKYTVEYLGVIGYECTNCRDFFLHARCALLPDTVTHKFDKHPLKLLITTERLINQEEEKEEDMFCEICEDDVDDRSCYYGCKECDQCFHVDCIPGLDELSRIKFGFTSTARVKCHDCPLACVRALSVDGYRCGHCQEIIRESDIIAFECSDCYFWIHKKCAQKLLM
ncbi:hypothetical protein CASFOL_004709 [Castilleja foliolosa]|uniref:Phorbol-ester/DAG-type domain-containing protein n=1 Tax=Castilleja foliolosa TaxID=1961234 RepID=A0ABD3EBQ9_9LAMI